MIHTFAVLTGLLSFLLALPAAAVEVDARLPGNRFMEFRLPHAEGSTEEIVAGPDGNLWVTQIKNPQVIRVTPIGETRRLPLPRASTPRGLVFDKAGRLWVAFEARNTLAEIDQKTGVVRKEYSLVFGHHRDIGPQALVLDKDGKTVWFAAKNANAVGKINTENGEVMLYPLPNPDSAPTQIHPDREGNLWYTAPEGGVVGFVNPDGFIFEFPVPEGSARPVAIVPDPDQPRMWFALEGGAVFASIDKLGNMNVFPLANPDTKLGGLAFDGRGRLWLTTRTPEGIARVGKNMTVTEWPLPTLRAMPGKILFGPDGNMWFIERNADKVGYVVDTAGYR